DEDNYSDDCIWEDGSALEASSKKDSERGCLVDGISVELDISQEVSGKVPTRRASSEEKEIAELVHKTHLLCLLGRGRLMDSACDDPLIQASLLSLVPDHLFKTLQNPKLTSSCLSQLVGWFRNNFRVRSSNISERSCHSSLVSLLQTREGTPEAVAGLSVSLFRALNLAARFVSMLDVAPLKPEATKSNSMEKSMKRKGDIFSSPTLMIADPGLPSSDSISSESNIAVGKSIQYGWKNQDSCISNKRKDKMLDDPSVSGVPVDISESKRKGDVEFELQMEVALAATAIISSGSPNATTPPYKKLKRDFSNGLSTAMGSKKTGAPIYWSEVFCNGENLTGRWVHVDAVSAIVDGEGNVEAAAAACKKSLRYAVAFSGNGAKDVTRRYCVKWYKIASERVDSTWWDSVLAPLKELESGTTERSTRSSMEDSELVTRALTEPLPTNQQQAYRNHQLYAIERWIKKYEVLHPKEPVLGYCGGHPVYPRTCVQKLHTKEMWLREGLQVKAGESPAKVLYMMHSEAKRKQQPVDHDGNRRDEETTATALYGKWQTEPLRLPRAVDGIVPKNERGQVEVWSEKCIPPGTVHLRYPRIGGVARKLGIDFAPAMVGFEWRRGGGSVPVFDGIVLCSEFEDAVMEAYSEEEGRREGEEKRRREMDACRRWHQLLSSLATLRRLNCSYGDGKA
ncbi:hypothetical protein M569_09796, partial [Genlisea aurea]